MSHIIPVKYQDLTSWQESKENTYSSLQENKVIHNHPRGSAITSSLHNLNTETIVKAIDAIEKCSSHFAYLKSYYNNGYIKDILVKEIKDDQDLRKILLDYLTKLSLTRL